MFAVAPLVIVQWSGLTMKTVHGIKSYLTITVPFILIFFKEIKVSMYMSGLMWCRVVERFAWPDWQRC